MFLGGRAFTNERAQGLRPWGKVVHHPVPLRWSFTSRGSFSKAEKAPLNPVGLVSRCYPVSFHLRPLFGVDNQSQKLLCRRHAILPIGHDFHVRTHMHAQHGFIRERELEQ